MLYTKRKEMLVKSEVYDLIEDHYRANFKPLCMRYRGPGGSRANGEDIVQEAYTRAMTYWESFNVEADFKKWFNRILLNCLKDKVKEERSHGFVDQEEMVADVQHKAFHRLVIDDVKKIIYNQPANIRYILTLYFFGQYPTQEIAQLVPESHSNIRRQILLFRKKLRRQFKTRLFE
jgi:RNA polymerase sigma factor (sigma-70 family)